MKTLFFAIALLAYGSCFAQSLGQGGGNGGVTVPLFTKIIPSSPMMRNSVKTEISIYVDGKVIKTVSQFQDDEVRTTFSLIANIIDMSQINKCSSELRNVVLNSYDSSCMDAPTIRYILNIGDVLFATKNCNDVNIADVPCGKKMVEVLDGLSSVSK
jgi:hypothetical protein